MKYILGALSLIFLVSSIRMFSSQELLTEVPHEKALQQVVYGQKRDLLFLPYRNASGEKLSKEESNLLNEGKLARRFFSNRRNEIKEIRCFPMSTAEDTINEKRLTKLIDLEPLKEIDQVNINCEKANLDYVHSRLFSDSDYSKHIDSLEFYRFIDLDNLAITVSVIEQCGFPFQKETVRAAYDVVLSSPVRGVREYYYESFRQANKKGLISKKDLLALKAKVKGGRSSFSRDTIIFDDFFKNSEAFAGMNMDSIKQLKIDEIIAQMQKE